MNESSSTSSTPVADAAARAVTRSAFVTGGGTTGIGRAAAIALAAEGYTVTVAGRTAATLEQTVKLIADAGGTAKSHRRQRRRVARGRAG